MERILVCLKEGEITWEALARALALARRIKVRLYVLQVFHANLDRNRSESEDMKRLKQCIKEAGDEGLHIDFFVTEGNFEQEVIDFVQRNKITLLITEHWRQDSGIIEREKLSLEMIRHRVSCRVEVVTAIRSEHKEDGEQ